MTARSVRNATVVVLLLLMAAVCLAPDFFARHSPTDVDVGQRFLSPSWEHPFGTDDAGRDIFDRMIYGARLSIGAALAVTVVAAAVGTVYGAVAGWVGGRTDRVMMKVVDVFLAFPYLVLAMAIAASVGRDLRSAVLALTLVWWPSYARTVRSQVLSLRGQLHVKAARTLGASGGQLLRWHVVPHTFDQLLARVTLDVGYVLVALTGLSFLGLGAQQPSPEWGLMISNAKTYALNAWWYATFTGLVLVLTVTMLVWLGDRLAKAVR